MKKIYFIIIALIMLIYIFYEVRKKKFSIKESFWWVLAAIIGLLLAIFPHSIEVFAKWFGIKYAPSFLFILCILFLTFICFRNSRKTAESQEKIIELEQQLTIIKSQVKENNYEKR